MTSGMPVFASQRLTYYEYQHDVSTRWALFQHY